MLHRIAVLAAAALIAACSSRSAATPPVRSAPPAPLRSLDEPEAIALIERLLREAKQRPVAGWEVPLPKRGALDVDLRLGDTTFGIEWVSPEDRNRYGDLLPAPDPGGQLRLLASSAAGHQALILVLDHESYRVTTRVDSPSSEEIRALEQRLRRDLTDFIEYARSQYRL